MVLQTYFLTFRYASREFHNSDAGEFANCRQASYHHVLVDHEPGNTKPLRQTEAKAQFVPLFSFLLFV